MRSPKPKGADPDALPATPGAYLLVLRLDGPAALSPRFGDRLLPAGSYLYAGSARGRGGIRARCRRHLQKPRIKHWHIDWLTSAAIEIRVIAVPGGNECALVERLMQRPGISIPIPGFGSSDCRQCMAHLLQIDGHAIDDALAVLKA